MTELNIIRKQQLRTKSWSGGTTTQLAIHPADSEYEKRNFTWRLSTAVIEVEESQFTDLPGYKRILMILDGELDLVHENRYSKHLQAGEKDSFGGDWKTRSYGMAKDFNLIFSDLCEGDIDYYIFSQSEKKHIKFESNNTDNCTIVVYISEGTVETEYNGSIHTLYGGDLLMLKDVGKASDLFICNISASDSAVVCANISIIK
ncbi:MAG: HutD family protein [Bacillota bacterium]